jgi:FAD binding domain/Berberine and berberine like
MSKADGSPGISGNLDGAADLKTRIEDLCAALRPSFRGDLLRPGQSGYAKAHTVWNAMVARTPGLIARCRSVTDVQVAVRAANAGGALTAIRCGGHSLAGFGTCDGGLVIDLSGMREVAVDEENRRARFSGGCLLGGVDSATQKVGLAFPSGVVSHTGTAGLVLGGGTGWLNRLYGLSCDSVEGFTVVLADGSLLRADATRNSDLFWALRGGGGNFGVVTEFEVRLHPVSAVLFGKGMALGENALLALQDWRDFMAEAPDNLRWGFSLRTMPEANSNASRVRGMPVASATALWVGDVDQGRRFVERALARCETSTVATQVLSFLSLQVMADNDFPHGRRYYTKSAYFRSLDDSSIETLVSELRSNPSVTNEIELAYLGGAAARVAPEETAFGDRSAPFIMNLLGNWEHAADDAANIAWIRGVFTKVRPATTPGVYVNFMSEDEQNRVREAYRTRWERLVAIKSKYDPENFFRLNQNINPRETPANSR